MTAAASTSGTKSKKTTLRRVGRVLLWVFGVPAVLLLALYAKLLFGPIPLPFAREQAQIGAIEALPENISVEFGDTALATENGFWPVIQFTPVTITDSDSGAIIRMDALEIGFLPIQAIFGRPGVSVTMVRPHIQLVQDLFGPRLAGFQLVDDEDGDDATIRIIEGENSLPSVRISSQGLDIRGALPSGGDVKFRSDNDWLIFNLLATEEGLIAFEEHASQGRFSRFRVRDGILDMHDPVYGFFRQFTKIEFDISPSVIGQNITGAFAAELAGRQIKGTVLRTRQASGEVSLQIDTTNLDFAALLPFIDDPDGTISLRGAGQLGIGVTFGAETGEIDRGIFDVDMTGAQVRIQSDLFPVTTQNLRIEWTPSEAQFSISDALLEIGQSSALLSGVFVTGLDATYGPTLSMSLEARNLVLHPNDMEAPRVPFEEVAFSGWAAPLYGAIGIDQMVVRKPGVLVRAMGRADVLRTGIGFNMEIGVEGASADDLKRLWPYLLATEARDWFVENVTAGKVEQSTMLFDFPVGSTSSDDAEMLVPKGALTIDMIGQGVHFKPTKDMAPIAVKGETRLQLRDNITTVGMDGAELESDAGLVSVADVAFIIDTETAGTTVFELSGDISSSVQPLLAFAKEQSPELLEGAELPVDLDALSGKIDGSIVATIVMAKTGELKSIDYAANGTIGDFASSEPIASHSISDGQFGFSVSQDGYNVSGDTKVSGIDANLNLSGKLDGEPDILISAELEVAELEELGFDASGFLGGKVRFAAKPMLEGELQIDADLTNASVNVTDLGIRKAVGVEGRLSASIKQDGEKFAVSDVDLAFGDLQIKGAISFDAENGLESADFSTFALSPGDSAQLLVTPGEKGIALRLRGEQLDFKPMLKRFFALDEVSTGGPQSTQFEQELLFDIELERAVGFYRTTAYNLDLELDVLGEDLRAVSMQAQFTEGSSVSVTTNPTQVGRTMSIAFNDAGTLLRFLNVYPRLAGGNGSLIMTTDNATKLDTGTLNLQDFSLVDEEKVIEILGNHKDSRALIANQNRINFNNGQVHFIRSPDRIEVVDAVLDGDSIGGTAHGFVYTQAQEYDLVGTYIPLFALNSFFQKLPLLGPLLGGREGEGLVGVTFAVRGDLDDPQFLINPASILLPGVFRSIMEFRSREKPQELQ